MYVFIKNLILDILSPSLCLLCKNYPPDLDKEMHICTSCLRNIPWNSCFFCVVCERRLPELSSRCRSHSQVTLCSAAPYNYAPIKNLIWELKFRNTKVAAKTLAKILFTYTERVLLKELHSIDFIIPIPLHYKREKERGYNQSELISRYFIDLLSLQVLQPIFDTASLTRVKYTEPQTEKNRDARLINLHDAFEVRNGTALHDKCVLLIDDVYTSGATMRAAAYTLKKHKVKRIICLTLAQA